MDEPEDSQSAVTSEINGHPPDDTSRFMKLAVPVLITAIVMLLGMSTYQVVKYLLLPEMSLVQSNIITVLFSSGMATVAAYFIARKRQHLLQQTMREVEERRKAEDKVNRLNEELKDNIAQLEAANNELQSFSYSVSHDLRAPLRHVIGYVELLQKNASHTLDPKGMHYLDTISGSAKRMGILIDDLLTFSRIGRVEMQHTKFSLGQLINEVLHDQGPETEGRRIRWEIRPLPDVYGDRALIKLVFMNLVSNSIKFTSPREEAVIEIGRGPESVTETVVFVRDNGVGFDMKYSDKLFGVFQRLHSTGQFEGTGIGLANVQRIINRHGGRTWAEGAVDGGATFYVSIPKQSRED